MKKTKKRVIMRGQIATGTYSGHENRLQVFDGKYTTGYKVVEFRISPNNPDSSQEYSAKLSTEPISTISAFNWQNIQEFAWATWGEPSSAAGDRVIIAEDNMVVEDLYVSAYTSGEGTVFNYYIVLDQYEFPAWTGAGILVENLSQAGPQ